MAVSSSWCTNKCCLHIMLIGLLLLCMRAIPLCLCLGEGGGSILGGSCIKSERRALFAIKADIYDPDQWLSSWKGQDCCGWRGVGCDNTTGHVVKLDLRYPYNFDSQLETGKFAGLSKVNPSLLDLMHLKYLDLSLNNFSGAPIPKFIGSFMHLEYLNLSNAEFSGSIPPELGNLSTLYFLDLHSDSYYCQCYNFFCPDCVENVDPNRWFLHADDLHWLSRIHSLQFLDMNRVNLSMAANWLHEINMLPSLLELHLSETNLPSIPGTVLSHVNLTSLRVLDLSWNDRIKTIVSNLLFNISSSLVQLNLEGFQSFPDRLLIAIGDLRNLQHLELSYNQITGENFQSLGNLSNLQHLDLSSNQINRDIFQNLRNLSHLQHLDLSFNQITGEIFQNLENLGHLKYLDLSINKISGDIPEKLGNLNHLENLFLVGNRISGVIPKSIGNLCSLLELDLRGNLIHGEIPESIGNLVQLQQMSLSNNMISGEIPDVFDKLHSLRVLALPRNRMTGKIPRSLGNLCMLNILDISQNNINGEIADIVEGWSECIKNTLDAISSSFFGLTYLDMSSNNLSGIVPESLAQLSTLQILSFASNSFTGLLTEAHFANLRRLYGLDLSYNSFEVILSHDWNPPFNAREIGMCSCHLGPKFPTWLRTQTNLYWLQLSENSISDDFPSWFWDLRIATLNVSHNSMTGKLPTPLGGQQYGYIDMSSNNFHGLLPELDPSLSMINLSNNSFEGPIPLSFARAMRLQFLLLSNNYINGSIHPFICNLTDLVILDLSNNNLSGRLPNCWHKSQLGTVDSQKDSMLGQSQGSMGGPINLQSLHMRKNGLSGDFPLFLRYCKQLTILDLSENKFSGNLPIWIGESLVSLRVLSLRSNFFDGNIPEQLSCLTSLQVLDLACNNFSGILPSSFGNFSAMMATENADRQGISENYSTYYTESLLITRNGIEIEYTSVLSLVMSIDLSHNNLSGMIPEKLVNLRELLFLNLSNNHFIGRIPENIGDLEQLELLDLSVNNLSGMIPSTMSSMHFLSHLNLSNNNLSGGIPWGNQLQTFCDPSIYNGNPNLHGWPLPWCSNRAPSNNPFQTEGQEEESENKDIPEKIWLCISCALGFVVGFWGSIYALMIKQTTRIAYFQLIDKIFDHIYVQLAICFAKLKPILRNNIRG